MAQRHGRLVRQIDESGLIARDDLDILAQTLVAAGPQVFWEVPGDWFGGPAITIDLGPTPAADDPDDDKPADSFDDGPVLLAREVRPPLRRWAAGRIVRADPSMWGQLVNRAQGIDPRGGAAIVRGVLDGIDGLTPAARGTVVKLATTWPQRDVRDAAADLAASPTPDHASSPMPARGPHPDLRSAARPTSQRDAAQPSLF